jgi:uncharacterized MAPEG superfamily protein
MFSTTLIICIFIASTLPYIWTGYAKAMGPGYNNSTTRDFIENLTGKRRRAHYAQLNQFEALPIFFISLFVALSNKVPLQTIEAAAIIHVIARMIYGLTYIYDQATFRTLIWSVAIGTNVYLLFQSCN